MADKIDTVTLKEALRGALTEVFETMIFMPIQYDESLPPVDKDTDIPHLTSFIGLAGKLKGMVSICCPEPVAVGVTSALLGMDVEQIDSDVKDAVGEIANMLAGGFKTKIANDGIDVEIAVPTTVVGTKVRVGGLGRAAYLCTPFSTSVGPLYVELKYSET